MESKHPMPFEPSGAFHYIKLAIEIVKLNGQAMGQAAKDKNALTFGLAMTAIGGGLTVISHTDLRGLVVCVLFAVVTLFLFAAFVHLLAGYSKGKEEFLGLVRITALSGILDWLAVTPLTALLVTIWSVVVAVVATRKIYDLKKSKATVFVLLSASALWAIALVLFTGPLGVLYETPRP